MKRDLKGFILAAGLGTRLRPLTLHYPKPLLPFCGPSLLDLAIWRMNSIGFRDHSLAVNSHYLAAKIADHLRARPQIFLSHEASLLGTGGAVKPLSSWLEDAALMIYNGDVISDIDLKALKARHDEAGVDATMVLLNRHVPQTTPVYAENGRIVQIGGESTLPAQTFSGVHLVTKELLNRLPNQGFSSITDAYQAYLMDRKPIACFTHVGFWHDLGTPSGYLSAIREFLSPQNFPLLFASLGIREISQTLGLDHEVKTFSSKPGQVDGYSLVPPNFQGVVGPGAYIDRRNDFRGKTFSTQSAVILPEAPLPDFGIVQNSILGYGEVLQL